MNCPHCTTELTRECRHCPQCGNALAPAEAQAALTVLVEDSQDIFASRPLAASRPTINLTEQEREAIHRLLTQANLSRAHRQWAEAIDYCVEALRANPGDQTAHSLLGDIYRDQGKWDDALQWYRMAIDLKATPADETNLRQCEQEIARQSGLSVRFDRQGRKGGVSLSPNEHIPAGTVNLMGLSPRRWLRALTITSLGFLAITAVTLVFVVQRGKSSSSREKSASRIVGQSPSLPEKRVVSGAPGYGAISPPATFPPAAPSAPPTSGYKPPVLPARPPMDIPSAPVTSVKPLYETPAPPPAPGGTATPATPQQPQGNPAFLNGIRVNQIHLDKNNGKATILAAAAIASPEQLTDEVRSNLIRSVYAIARQLFSNDAAPTQATILFQTGTGAIGTLLLTAEIDRATALAATPETDAIDRLESGLLSLRWAGQEPKPSAPSTPPPPRPASITLSPSS